MEPGGGGLIVFKLTISCKAACGWEETSGISADLALAQLMSTEIWSKARPPLPLRLELIRKTERKGVD